MTISLGQKQNSSLKIVRFKVTPKIMQLDVKGVHIFQLPKVLLVTLTKKCPTPNQEKAVFDKGERSFYGECGGS